ncbi:MAG: periplasmic heavy metal sensor [Nitrospirae bacterium]|nr:periplasmic heavy metal sensor [Nitrospirota bacterium]
MKTNVVIGAMSLIALLGLGVQPSLAVYEQRGSHADSGKHGCCDMMMGHMGHAGQDAPSADHLQHLLKHQKEIGLTEEQVKKLEAIELDFDRGRIKIDAEVQVAERELRALAEDEKTDLSAIEAKVKQSGLLDVGRRMLAFKARHDALAVLTPEQRAKGKDGHGNKMQGMHGGMHGGMEGMMGSQHGGSPAAGH